MVASNPRCEDSPDHLPLLVALPAGEYLRGSADDDPLGFANERPRHRVSLAPFRMATTPVTREAYQHLTGQWLDDWQGDDPRLPATHLSWTEAALFCNALSRRQGLSPCYQRHWLWRFTVQRIPGAGGYRLPTEAEWEYAARAGTAHHPAQDDPPGLDDHAWYADNAGQRPQAVATRRANPWALYDLAGNVWEWCEDWWQPYGGESQDNPVASLHSAARVVRGGCYSSPARDLRPATRNGYPPATTSKRVGFRVVRDAH